MIRIHDSETGTDIDREMTDGEAKAYAADQAIWAAKEKEKADREVVRKAIFTKLGITQEEAALLLS